MDHAEFMKFSSDPKYTFGFINFYKSMRVALGEVMFWGYVTFQVLLGLAGIVGLAYVSYQYGPGNLVWILPALWALLAGKISLNFFDVVFLAIIFLVIAFVSALIQKWAGVKLPIYGSAFFLAYYVYTGVSKYIIMSWMIRKLRNDPQAFAVLNDSGQIFPWRIG